MEVNSSLISNQISDYCTNIDQIKRSRNIVNELPVKKLSLKARMLPIIFFEAYLNFTILIFAYGPWPWPVENGIKLYLFLIVSHLALFAGYLSGAIKSPASYVGKPKTERIIIISLILNLLMLIPTTFARSGSSIPDLVGGITNPGAAYAASFGVRAMLVSRVVEYIRIILGPLLYMLFPLTIFYWQNLKRSIRLWAVFSIAAYTAIYISIGTNKGVFDLVLLSPWLVLGARISGSLKLKWKRKLLIALMIIVLFVFALAFFTTGQLTRSGSGAESGYFSGVNIYANSTNGFVRYLPDRAKVGFTSLAGYLTQGYYALSLSLDKPFVPMFGLGNSMFLFKNAAELTGIEAIEKMPYPVRIEEDGWSAFGNWSSIYPWIASDVSFPGTILIVFFIGRFFALSWIDTLRGHNPFAVAIFTQFLTMVYYFSANNQVLQSGESLVSFYIILILWLVTRKKRTSFNFVK